MNTSRRHFLLGTIALAAALPLLPKSLFGQVEIQQPVVQDPPLLADNPGDATWDLLNSKSGREKLAKGLQPALQRRMDMLRKIAGLPVSKSRSGKPSYTQTALPNLLTNEMTGSHSETLDLMSDRLRTAYRGFINNESLLKGTLQPGPVVVSSEDNPENQTIGFNIQQRYY